VGLRIPAIGVDIGLLELGQNPDGTVQVPPLEDPASTPGWYDRSPTPGALGPAVILGHVDSKAFGPGVFYELGALQPGDAVEVTRADGLVAMFRIEAVRSVLKAEFPTREVYGNLDHAGLRLITCGGQFDPDASSYTSNIIAFARFIGSRPA
jgi:sortase (surface protein transpeptidase)